MESLGRRVRLERKQRRSYTGFGRGWRESRGGATGEVGETGGKHMRSYWGGGLSYSESRGGVTGEVGGVGEKAEEELLGR